MHVAIARAVLAKRYREKIVVRGSACCPNVPAASGFCGRTRALGTRAEMDAQASEDNVDAIRMEEPQRVGDGRWRA